MFPCLLVRGFCGVPVKSGEVFVGLRYLKLSLAGWKGSAHAQKETMHLCTKTCCFKTVIIILLTSRWWFEHELRVEQTQFKSHNRNSTS